MFLHQLTVLFGKTPPKRGDLPKELDPNSDECGAVMSALPAEQTNQHSPDSVSTWSSFKVCYHFISLYWVSKQINSSLTFFRQFRGNVSSWSFLPFQKLFQASLININHFLLEVLEGSWKMLIVARTFLCWPIKTGNKGYQAVARNSPCSQPNTGIKQWGQA